MTDTLFQAYLPLLVWPALGLLLFRFLPRAFPRWLGRSLYWVGVPLEILSLSRRADFSGSVGLAPIFVVSGLLLAFVLATLSWEWLHKRSPLVPSGAAGTLLDPLETLETLEAQETKTSPSARQGSFVLSAMLGNTGFVGLAIAPALVSDRYLSWVVFYSIAHNILGTYGLGVFCASYFGRTAACRRWWIQLRDVLMVPSLWAFGLGMATRSVSLPSSLESGLQASVWIVIPGALILMGMRLSQIQKWQSVQLAIAPTLIKTVLVPATVGLIATLLHVMPDPRFALVLMSGMPSAFAGLILAEEYNLDRDLIASSIVLSTGALLISIPLWIAIFPT